MTVRRSAAGASLIAVLGCLTAALLAPERSLAQDLRSFPPDPQCAPRLVLSPTLEASSLAAGRGDLFVRLQAWDDTASLAGGRADLSPLDDGRAIQRGSLATDSNALGRRLDSGGVYPFTKSPAGRYLLTARRIGYGLARDTVVIRAGASDTLVITMPRDLEDQANAHNCRPHHFRAPGEPACYSDSAATKNLYQIVLRWAKSPGDRKFYKLPSFTPKDVAIIHDPTICEAAAAEYGAGTHDPPRRVVVVRGGPVYWVFDPLEPVRGGEFVLMLVLDRHYHVVKAFAD